LNLVLPQVSKLLDKGGLTLHSVVGRKTGFIEAEIDGEVVALNIEQGTCYGMNQVASRIWKLLEVPARISVVCETLVAEYAVPDDVCEQQVLELLEELCAEGMITKLEDR